MGSPRGRFLRVGAFVIGALVIVAITAAAWPHVAQVKDWWTKQAQNSEKAGADRSFSAQLVPQRADTLMIPADVVKKLGVTSEVVRSSTQPRVLELSGTLALDTDELSTIHTPFPGEVVEIEDLQGVSESNSPVKTVPRKIGYGDKVTKGQLLAVVWNTDLGNKKNDLIDALSDERVKREYYDGQKKVYEAGSASESAMRQAKRDLEAAVNKVRAAERTLRTLHVPEGEIEAVIQEGKRIAERQGKRDVEKEKNWARVEIRAKSDGIVLERNVALGDIIDTSKDLFRIANLDHLKVWAHAFEEEIPALEALSPSQRHWQIRLQAEPSAPPIEGRFDVIGYMIDPNQHTASVIGKVNNSEGRLRPGYFVTCRIELPPSPHEVTIPATALVDDGNDSIVFVQAEDPQVFNQRRVAVARRGRAEISIKTKPRPDEEKLGIASVSPGERVVTAGAIELKAALEDLKATTKK